MFLLLCLAILGWVAASVLGTQAYFRGEQTKPVRNVRSQTFAQLAAVITGRGTDLSNRVIIDQEEQQK